MPQLPAVTRFDEVSFSYEGAQEPALTGVELEWRPGEVLALAGLNGSGKSTCLRVLLRLGSLKGGVVRVGGASLAELGADEWRTKVAFLPQRPYIPARASVRAAVAWPFQTIPPSDERILKALDRVGLLPTLRATEDKPLEVRVDTLSVGQRQRVALARLLCRDASVFLLDEPDANLDRAGIALVESLLRELAQQGMVAFAAHTPELVVVADHVLALEKGRVVSEPTSSRRRS
jgi:ATP-binding cassette subfamily C protein CydCD